MRAGLPFPKLVVDRKITIRRKDEATAPIWSKVGDRQMYCWTWFPSAALPPRPFAFSTPATAGVGDLLVAPDPHRLDGRKGTEIVLNNIGDEPATYRVSVELRRMTPTARSTTSPARRPRKSRRGYDYLCAAAGHPGAAPAAGDPDRGARRRKGLPDGEYRVHLLFRAIPPANPVVQPQRPSRPRACASS